MIDWAQTKLGSGDSASEINALYSGVFADDQCATRFSQAGCVRASFHL